MFVVSKHSLRKKLSQENFVDEFGEVFTARRRVERVRSSPCGEEWIGEGVAIKI